MEWSEFAERLGRELAGLDRDTILIVREHDESRHYVQAMREPDRLYAEAVSNNFLEGPLLLTPADEEVLTEAGWRSPTADWSPANWWTELPPLATATDYAGLADMMVTALRDVQGLRRPADLVYESFHRHGTGLIELVDFGIPPADPSRITEHRTGDGQDPASAADDGAVRGPGHAADRASGQTADRASGPAAGPRRIDEAMAALSAPPMPDPHKPAPGDVNRVNGANGAAPSGHAAHQPAPPRPAPPNPRPSPSASPSASPSPSPSPSPSSSPAQDAALLEARLAEAKQRGDHLACFELLLTTDHLLLLLDETATDQNGGRFATTTIGTGTYLMAFTSPQAMADAMTSATADAPSGTPGDATADAQGDRHRPHRAAGFGELAAAWPHPHWSLVVNAGLPSEIHLDAATVARLDDMRRTAARAATVDAIVDVPRATAAKIADLPHGSRLWRYDGRSLTQVAAYDAASGHWTVADAAPRTE
ncbi:hypothetical protein GCM10009780_58460 [Actinomadura alba]